MRVAYLSNDSIYLRAPVWEDKERAAAWFDSPFPVNAPRAEEFLRTNVTETWEAERIYLLIVRRSDEQVVGGISVAIEFGRIANVGIHMAPALEDADQLRASGVELLIPWLRDEHEHMVVVLRVAADEPATIAAAERLGMELAVRLREFVARSGHRVDGLLYQALNPRWQIPDA